MANYSTDEDLLRIRPGILQYGEDWEDKHVAAKQIIDRELEAHWYRENAANWNIDPTDVPFDSSLVDRTYLVRLSAYKTLELIYTAIMLDTAQPDGFKDQRAIFAELYKEELSRILATGLGYDWDSSGAVEPDERLQPRYRRLKRA